MPEKQNLKRPGVWKQLNNICILLTPETLRETAEETLLPPLSERRRQISLSRILE
jgi:hypothetical protein